MKKEISTYIKVCDICEVELLDEKHIKHNEVDLCLVCLGNLFDRFLSSKVTNEVMVKWISDMRPLDETDIEIVSSIKNITQVNNIEELNNKKSLIDL